MIFLGGVQMIVEGVRTVALLLHTISILRPECPDHEV